MYFDSKLIILGVWDITDSPDEIKPYVNMYLIEGSKKAVLIDAGVTNADLAGYVRRLTSKPVELVLTHGHGDHTANSGQFDTVYMSGKDTEVLFAKPQPSVPDPSGIINLSGGEVFDLGDCKIEVIALPGHTHGSVVLLDRERQLFFAGDALGSAELWMQLPHSTAVSAYLKELYKLEKQLDGLDELRVFLGHDCLMEQKPDKQYIADVRITAEKIVSGEFKGIPAGDRPAYRGCVYAACGQMRKLLFMPDNI